MDCMTNSMVNIASVIDTLVPHSTDPCINKDSLLRSIAFALLSAYMHMTYESSAVSVAYATDLQIFRNESKLRFPDNGSNTSMHKTKNEVKNGTTFQYFVG
eukprot:3933610-Rhodomonas_salina.5